MRYTATDAMYDSTTADERDATETVLTKMQHIMPQQRQAFVAKIRSTPVVKIGAVELGRNAVDYLISRIERM